MKILRWMREGWRKNWLKALKWFGHFTKRDELDTVRMLIQMNVERRNEGGRRPKK